MVRTSSVFHPAPHESPLIICYTCFVFSGYVIWVIVVYTYLQVDLCMYLRKAQDLFRLQRAVTVNLENNGKLKQNNTAGRRSWRPRYW